MTTLSFQVTHLQITIRSIGSAGFHLLRFVVFGLGWIFFFLVALPVSFLMISGLQ